MRTNLIYLTILNFNFHNTFSSKYWHMYRSTFYYSWLFWIENSLCFHSEESPWGLDLLVCYEIMGWVTVSEDAVVGWYWYTFSHLSLACSFGFAACCSKYFLNCLCIPLKKYLNPASLDPVMAGDPAVVPIYLLQHYRNKINNVKWYIKLIFTFMNIYVHSLNKET